MTHINNCGLSYYDGSGGSYYQVTDSNGIITHYSAWDESDLSWIPSADKDPDYDCSSIDVNYPEESSVEHATLGLLQTIFFSTLATTFLLMTF